MLYHVTMFTIFSILNLTTEMGCNFFWCHQFSKRKKALETYFANFMTREIYKIFFCFLIKALKGYKSSTFFLIIIKTHTKNSSKVDQRNRKIFSRIADSHSHNSNKHKKAKTLLPRRWSSRRLGKVRGRSTFKEQAVDALYKLTEKAKNFMNEK